MLRQALRQAAPRFGASPLGALRSLRVSAPAQQSEVTRSTTPGGGYVTTVDPSKFVDGESLTAHQARVRHADPANRTFNYAMIGAPRPARARRCSAPHAARRLRRSRVPLPPRFLSRQLDRPAAVGGAKFISASAWRLCLIKFLAQMNPAADVLAMASLEVDISKLSMGECITVKWRGKPVFIRSRTEDEIAEAADVNLAELRDPENDLDRVQKPETLIVLGVCTHLGCVPINKAGDYNGWFCPCHGSHYDTSGRIRKGPAPLNMEVPPYSFIEEEKLLIG